MNVNLRKDYANIDSVSSNSYSKPNTNKTTKKNKKELQNSTK